MSLEFVIGATDSREPKTWVGYRIGSQAVAEVVCVSLGSIARDSDTYVLSPAEMLEHRPYVLVGHVMDGIWRTNRAEREPPGWFERKCREANCEWFVPFVKRMADGEAVPLKEIEAAYLAHNGKPMPCGKWSELFR
jgi:hypothetical protein